MLAAAAEYRRREDVAAPGAGFQALAEMPNEIKTALPTMFQPLDAARVGVLNARIDPDHKGLGRWARTAARVVAAEKAFFLLGLLGILLLVAPGLLIVDGLPRTGGDWGRLALALVLPLLLALTIGLLFAGVGLARTVVRLLPRLDYGLTDGATHQAEPGLTQWLAERIQQVAGLERDGRPLTLGDLWRAPAGRRRPRLRRKAHGPRRRTAPPARHRPPGDDHRPHPGSPVRAAVRRAHLHVRRGRDGATVRRTGRRRDERSAPSQHAHPPTLGRARCGSSPSPPTCRWW